MEVDLEEELERVRGEIQAREGRFEHLDRSDARHIELPVGPALRTIAVFDTSALLANENLLSRTLERESATGQLWWAEQ